MYEYENKDLRLQQDCNEIVQILGKSIIKINEICQMNDTDRAVTAFARELATIIAECAKTLGADMPETEKF